MYIQNEDLAEMWLLSPANLNSDFVSLAQSYLTFWTIQPHPVQRSSLWLSQPKTF